MSKSEEIAARRTDDERHARRMRLADNAEELLAALQGLLPIVESLDKMREEDEPPIPELIRARAAISKIEAEGL